MKILILEPFYTGSHRQWALGFQQHSQHDVEILSMPGRHWKWRMHGAAVWMADQFQKLDFEPDLVIASDMLDLAVFRGLINSSSENIKFISYFHENQITYPWSPTDADIVLKRDNHYGFINYTSALAAVRIFFNSQYHLDSFTKSLPDFLKQFPDFQHLQSIQEIITKSEVLYLGMDLKAFDFHKQKNKNEVPIILWNHRWEYDKNPAIFYKLLLRLKQDDIDFRLIILGERFKKSPKAFDQIKSTFENEIIHFGYTDDKSNYIKLLWQADILPVTSNQDFFGGSIIEAIYANCIPLLPNRLAYPEHIPDTLKDLYIYTNENDLYLKLKSFLQQYRHIKDENTLSDFVSRYDWSTLALTYDRTFEKLVN